MLKEYYYITKPGIIRGNLMIAVAAYIYGSQWIINAQSLLGMTFGTALVIASACVYNNVLDREIDALMARTSSRAIPMGKISIRSALIYASVLGILGFLVLIVFVNLLTFLVGLVGLLSYVLVYGYFKRKSVHGTLVGSVSGSMPPIAGYTAATNHLDVAALILFLILASWQMAHFYSIAIYRFADYKQARLPIYSVVNGIPATQKQILVWTAVYTGMCASLYLLGYAGLLFALIAVGFGLIWLSWGVSKLHMPADKWAKSMFGWSLLGLLSLTAALILNPWSF